MRSVVCALIFSTVFSLSTRAQEESAPAAPSLTLQEAVDAAVRNHPTIRMGQATVEAAQQRVHQQIASYLPSGRYTYTYSRQERPLTAAVGGVQVGGVQQQRATSQLFNFHSTNFQLSQLLFDFGRTLDLIQSAIASVEASTADLETTKQTVIFNTKQAYYGVLSAQRLLGVAEETVRQNQRHLEEAQARFDVGVAPRFDVTNARVQLSNAELSLVQARNNVALGFETLRRATGQPEPLRVTLVDSLERRPLSLVDDAILQQAYRRRPELESLRAQQRALSEQIAALQKQFLPSVSGTAQYNWTGREYPLQQGWLWGVTLTMPLFDNILTYSQLGETQANLRNLQAQEENIRQQVTLEVRQGVLNLRQAEESIRVNEQTVVQAKENLDLAEGRYAAGVGNIIELTDAQVSLTSAQANLIGALYNYKTALAQLEKAVGFPLE
ncbi:MAG TPA: TolC family protein [Methylomirabilota bacterium]|jgi:outer membrane protein TolC|nr:TolC family protein [Methylomirabilota bacterium]